MQAFLTNKTIEKLKYDLVRDGFITYEALAQAEDIAKSSNTNLAQVLIQQNYIMEEKLLNFLEVKLHIPSVNLEDYTLDTNSLSYIPYDDAKKFRIIPLFKIEDVLTLAMADPLNLFVLNNLINNIDCNIEPVLCSERSILEAVENHYQTVNTAFNANDNNETGFDWRDELNNESHDSIQAQKIIRAILSQAILENVHELYFEPGNEGINVRFKNSGRILIRGNIPVLLTPLAVFNLKIMSGLDSAVSEIPQLGKLSFNINGHDISCVVSTFPTVNGERITIKIYLPPKKFSELPIKNDFKACLNEHVNKHGLIIVGGSALSGKTSLIYSILSSLDSHSKNIMTIESIAKYYLEGVNQCELNEKALFDMNKAIGLIDFQAPDVLYIEGNLDKAGMAYSKALSESGKLVLTEFTADDPDDALEKLAKFNIDSSIACIIFINEQEEIVISGI